MSLGKPTKSLNFSELYPESAGNNQSPDTPLLRFAKEALCEWHENIPQASLINRRERRFLIGLLARQWGIDPCQMVAIVLIKRRLQRLAAYDVQFLFQRISA